MRHEVRPDAVEASPHPSQEGMIELAFVRGGQHWLFVLAPEEATALRGMLDRALITIDGKLLTDSGD